MERFCRTRLHYDADKNMCLLVKEMIEAIYQGIYVIFASIDTAYDSILSYMLQSGLTLLDSRFYEFFQYMSLATFAEKTHLVDSSVSLDNFLEGAVSLVPKGTTEVLIVLDHGSFIGGPYNLTTIATLAQLMVDNPVGIERHPRTPTGKKHAVRIDWPKRFSLVLNIYSHVMSSQELVYSLLNIPSLYIDNRMIPHYKNSTLRIPSNVNIGSLSSILNPLLVFAISKLINRPEANNREEYSSLLAEAELEYRNICYKELQSLHARCETLQSFIETVVKNSHGSLELTSEISTLLSTKPIMPTPYAQFVAEYTARRKHTESSTKPHHSKTPSHNEQTSPGLSVNTNLSWILGPDYTKATSASCSNLLHFQTIHDAIQHAEQSNETQSSNGQEVTSTTDQQSCAVAATYTNAPDDSNTTPKISHLYHISRQKYATLSTKSPSVGPYLEQLLQKKDTSEIKPAVVLPTVSKRLTDISSLAWSHQPPKQDEPLNSSTVHNSKEDANINAMHTPTKEVLSQTPVKPQGLRMLTKGKAIRLSESGNGLTEG